MANKSLIIAEKPSLAANIVAAIGRDAFARNDGYYESPEYIVSWVYGHLLGLKDIEEYDDTYDPAEKHSWTLDDLPFFPSEFQFELKKDPKTKGTDPGIKAQFNCLKKLASRKDVSCIIHAGDADREGEVIIRNVLNHIGNNKPVKRLWMPEQTEATIRNGLKSPEDDSNYDNLFNEGLARTYIDWLYGVNLTRLATLKSGSLLRVGRVIVPIVKAIYDRDTSIESFVPETYYIIASKEKTKDVLIELTSKRQFNEDQVYKAEAFCRMYNNTPAKVTGISKEQKTISPGKLYSLSKLQGVLGKKYKMSPKESMETIQKLYDSGYITYPRTNSEYLATAEAGKINEVIALFKEQGFPVEPKNGEKSIYNDSKIESHSALTPTYKLARKETLTSDEWLVYKTIRDRFLAVFYSIPCEVDRTTITVQVGDLETFELQGDIYINKGWKAIENQKAEDKELPSLAEGDIVNINFKLEEKETTPPKHYTVETLNNYLKNPFKKEDEYESIFEGLELGTEATRTGIIENAIASRYIILENNNYYIRPQGKFMIESLEKLGISMNKDKTAELGKALKKIYRNEMTIEDGIRLAEAEIKESFKASKDIALEKAPMFGANLHSFDQEPVIVGPCPACDSDVKATKKGYFCTNKDCSFALWPTMKYFNNEIKITETRAKALLTKGRALFSLKTKSGKPYKAYLKPVLKGKYVNFELDGFPERK